MTKKKNKFFTFCCSLIPGAGEMYLGFFKQGISIMTSFFLLFALGSILFAPVTVFCAVIWFYSFFHTNNLNSLPDDEFYAIQDDYMIHLHQIAAIRNVLLNRYRKATAIVLIIFGSSIIWKNIYRFFVHIAVNVLNLSRSLLDFISWFSRLLPQTITAVLIILLGIYLIRNKKKELEQ